MVMILAFETVKKIVRGVDTDDTYILKLSIARLFRSVHLLALISQSPQHHGHGVLSSRQSGGDAIRCNLLSARKCDKLSLRSELYHSFDIRIQYG